MPKENVTFLGVETSPVDGHPQRPAESDGGHRPLSCAPWWRTVRPTVVVQPHDVLLKLDDQVLNEVRQLAVLIRGKKGRR
jgi:hypothetical protein